MRLLKIIETILSCLLLGSLLFACSERKHNFTLLDNTRTGVHFENTLRYSEDINAYLFKSFYNGAGVALADLNNDGNLDLFLCGNQVSNRLYLGDGDFNFNDVTKTSGVESGGSWTTGISIVDINQDGWKDIYICKSGPLNVPNRRNQLFINTGVDSKGQLMFTESAAQYGIDDLGFSIHAIFLDYDRDGDIDMYLSNNSQHPSDLIISAEQGMREKKGSGNKLYKNVGSRFVDVTNESGIYDSPIGFGLGIGAADVNRDGWPDIYVANDFFEKDYLYLNQGDGTFKESIDELTNEISSGSMGVDIADLNHDGYPEIFVTEMLPEDEERLKTKVIFDSWDQYVIRFKNGYHRQFPRNTLQLNRGKIYNDSTVYFSEISRYANVAATDWSWGVQMADVDNDGQKEIFVTNGIGKDLLDRDFLTYYDNPGKLKEILKTKGVVMTELFDQMPSTPIANYLFKLDSDLIFSNVSKSFGIDQPSFSSGSAFGDIDNDGDLDLVVNNVNSSPFIYRNESNYRNNHFISIKAESEKGVTAIGAQLSIWAGGKLFFEEVYPMRGAMSTSDDRLLVGLGAAVMIDSMEIHWPASGVQRYTNIHADQFITITQNQNDSVRPKKYQMPTLFSKVRTKDALGINFEHKESDFVDFDKYNLLFQSFSNEGPKLGLSDIDDDGLSDLYIGGGMNQPGMVFKQNNGFFTGKNFSSLPGAGQGENQDALFFDADSDGDDDLLIATSSNEFSVNVSPFTNELYLNDGKGNFTQSLQLIPPTNYSRPSSVIAADIDHDGDLDLFVGNRNIKDFYGLPASSQLLRNDGTGKFIDATKEFAPELLEIGMVTDAVWSDFDRDGDADLIIVGEWSPIKVFANDKGRLTEAKFDGLEKSNGFWNTIEKVDLDGDGDEDFIAGNMGYNTFFKASFNQPVQMYIHDFDNNGVIDQVITTYRNGKSYPVAMKDAITRQLPYLLKRYLKFSSYKGQTIYDIFSKEQLKEAITLEVYETATSIIWNDGGQFNLQHLPYEAQLSPTYAIMTMDIDDDLRPDIILGGNQYNAKPQTGIYAGSNGTVLSNQKGRNFQPVPIENSGWFVKGQVRDIKKMKCRKKEFLLVARNNDSMEIFEINKQWKR